MRHARPSELLRRSTNSTRGWLYAVQRFLLDRRGVSSVEYALLLVAILLVAGGAYRLLGKNGAKAAGNSAQVLAGGEGSATGSGGYKGGNGGGDVVCDGRSCSAPGNCFVAGTEVATPSGERPIESLAAGDLVLTRTASDDAVVARPVVRTFVRPASSLVDVHLATVEGARERIRSTPEHPYWTFDRGWVPAGKLAANETLVDRAGHEVRVVGIAPIAQEATVYNLEVEGDHTYFVGDVAPVWVHNQCETDGTGTGSGSGNTQPPPAPSGTGATTGPVLGNQPGPAGDSLADKQTAVHDIVTDGSGNLVGTEDSKGVQIVPKTEIQDIRQQLHDKLGPPTIAHTPKGDIETWTLSTKPKSTITYRPFSSSGGADDPTIDFNNVGGLPPGFKRIHGH